MMTTMIITMTMMPTTPTFTLAANMLVSHCGEYLCECKQNIFAANSPVSGEYMANGLTNAIHHQSQ